MLLISFVITKRLIFCQTFQTPILVSSEVYNRVLQKHPEFIAKVEALGVKYIRVMPEDDDPTSAIGRGWKSTFLTDSKGMPPLMRVFSLTNIRIFNVLLSCSVL